MNPVVEELYSRILSEMLVDCDSRHNYPCNGNCADKAMKLLDDYTESIREDFIKTWKLDTAHSSSA